MEGINVWKPLLNREVQLRTFCFSFVKLHMKNNYFMKLFLYYTLFFYVMEFETQTIEILFFLNLIWLYHHDSDGILGVTF